MIWLSRIPELLANGPLVLVSVAGVRGSAPREPGASMLVGQDFTADTIGGGHLEWQAIAEARLLLQAEACQPLLRRYPLAASLGQCCGGVVWLAFEVLHAGQLPVWQAVSQRHREGLPQVRQLDGRAPASSWPESRGEGRLDLPATEDGPDWCLWQPLQPPRFCLSVYGAGHVGAALVNLLAPLEMRLRWCDPRAELMVRAPASVECCVMETPEEVVAQASAHSAHVVLTHEHALDLRLAEAILRRDDFRWFGLIGSQSKRTRFRQQLAARGIAPGQIERMICPIGVTGIRDKAPQAIAIAVATQVLQLREISIPA
ncbi:MAG: xanthine dehydrogenase accessory protein XdhC [Candidatus Dactylopiibacterium carminicum]|uniref:Xanthine dehydrogenase accessory protein XdhC n=1 Tax=Candidatus Dactylopiibacterium carminicum TaxID=857335 RepID=A0A272EU84_9RHOO|nr:xanthine dehydrogenase accessory protein XdhC [Candidatus Dactylopiibacterium carminicum]KAF7599319.1 xanthine dehydrogenase accessory protein XdhC [Candidatus Dactylopiibacterium carminicum]PAS93310.1 MAG: xanthine dehydrogenase accessory protein XdhC [Candidatus Dactylopiibacterium carminicum]PAS94332.1 MAG: xanthine dehydrogenase accessory protein XdhC [Candidatus Dactylopiibacterium carminicum]PAS99322.1 MAG: xanthine dehydrogenase accessory protein XdhC [Candidatus Dactylopiibacterium c